MTTFDLLWLSGVLIAALVALGMLILRLRRRYIERGKAGEATGPGFSIEELDAMHQAGTISKEEFRTLRMTALGLVKPQQNPQGGLTPPAGDVDGEQGPSDESGASQDTEGTKEQ